MPALIIYAAGLFSLIICDVLVTKFYPSTDVADWAQIRSLVAILSVLCLVGLDQVLIRSPQSSKRLLGLLAIQIPLLGVIWGLLVVRFGFLESWIWASLLCVGSTGSLVFFQYFRSHGHRIKSQLSQQSWKIIIFLCLVLSIYWGGHFPLDILVISALCLTVSISTIFAYFNPPSKMRPQDPEERGALYQIGARFMASSLLLSLSIYAEQLVVNSFGTTNEAAIYFTHATYFLFPISLANGYFAFLIGPWIRDNHDRFVSILRTSRIKIGFGIIIYVLIVQCVGYIGWRIIAPTGHSPDILIQLLFAMTCFARTLYTLPSAYLGVFGMPRQHDWLIAGQTLVLIFSVGLFALLHFGAGKEVIYAVACASMMNWILRLLIGAKISQSIARNT